MNSKLLDRIGLGNLDIAYVLIGILALCLILFIIVIVCLVQLSKTKKRINRFMKGAKAATLESDIVSIKEENEFLKRSAEQNRKDIRKIYHNLELTFQKVGIVKYDAFKEMGGKLSFSLALLNDKDDGFILNSVHSSDGCYSYTKEITAGACAIDLGEEEKEALQIAINSKQK
ncbi:MAG: DUF4446 family protein [Lachnospiraceae bacterium]|nr:DUF4446 family protein [Lachnospiraceae bacterium]MBD5482008.1 DUF4446 family protein [Lachnospiraceae bacterium]